MARLTQQGAVDIVNEFRNDNGYFDRLPEATLANVLDVQTSIADNPRMVNEFMETLFNKIVGTYIKVAEFDNPLKRFKRESETYGDTIEEIFIGLAEELVYDSDAKGTGERLLSTEETKMQAEYHKVNREAQFKGTTLQKEMVRALTSQGGLAQLLSRIVGQLTTSNEINEYKYMKSLLDSAYRSGDLYLVEVGDINSDNKFGTKAREYALGIKYPQTYNAAGVENTSRLENVSIVMSVETKSKFDTQTLAGAFNMSEADVLGSTVEIDKFHDDNVLAVLIDNSFFVVQDKMPAQMSSIYLADSLKTNWFLTVDQIISRSPFATAIAFVKEIPTDMKYKLHVSKPSLVLDDEDRKSQDVHTKLVGFDKKENLEDYEITVEGGATAIADTVVDEKGVITITLKDNIPAGEKETLTVVAKATVGGEEISHKTSIRVQKSSKIRI